MEDLWQQALADVVRSELALANRTAKDAYTSLGISSTAWQSYFKTRTRDVPSRVLIGVAGYVGMPLSELMAKTEARQAHLEATVDPVTAELEAGLSAGARRALDAAREAGEGEADPSGRARVDVDDGAMVA